MLCCVHMYMYVQSYSIFLMYCECTFAIIMYNDPTDRHCSVYSIYIWTCTCMNMYMYMYVIFHVQYARVYIISMCITGHCSPTGWYWSRPSYSSSLCQCTGSLQLGMCHSQRQNWWVGVKGHERCHKGDEISILHFICTCVVRLIVHLSHW